MLKSISNRLRNHPTPAFFILTFTVAWSFWLPLGILAPENYLLSLPGAWVPTLSALLLTGLVEGKTGLRNFLKRLLHWRVGFRWYVVALFGTAAIALLAIQAGLLLGVPAPELNLPEGLPRNALPVAIPVFFVVNIFFGGPLAEDVGWRGYILPQLRERMPTLHASLIIGVIWAVWHLSFFLFPGWRGAVGNIPFGWFLLLTTGWSVLFAWVYVNTESILMPVLYHAAINTTLGLAGQSTGNPILLVLNTLLTWIAAGMVVAFFGRDLKRSLPVRVEQIRKVISWSLHLGKWF